MESYNDAVYTGFNDGKANKYDNYINSGMLLINLERLKKVNYQEVFNLARVHYWPDQDVLCSYFANDILTLPIWDNFCIHYFYDELLEQNVKNAGITTEQVENFEKYANIVHISTRPKPNVLFNAQAYEIIKKYFTDFESYYNIFTYTNEQLDKLIVNYSKQEQTFLKKRLDEYRIALYARAQKTRLYERVFYI
jgi:lipopolysaccharide biosynthesis glycosyltransferase